VASPSDRLRRLRCWLTPPFGHLLEELTFFDSVAGRWCAFGRCVRCGALRSLSVGDACLPAADGMTAWYLPTAPGPPARTVSPTLPPSPRASVTLRTPADEAVVVSAALVRPGLRGARRRVFVAAPAGSAHAPAIGDSLAGAVRGAAAGAVDERWLERVERELGGELAG
jgi:hypothetical protein